MEKYQDPSALTELESAAIAVKEHLFDETVQLTGIAEYGISWQDLTGGKVAPPPQGARFDIAFEGALEGLRIKGNIAGVDYLTVRADGRFVLNLQASIETGDGERIAVEEDGILLPPQDGSGIAQLQLNLRFNTASPRYAWLNKLQAWGRGTADWNTGEVRVRVYAA